MAYYAGMAGNYDDLLIALTTACVSEGWSFSDSIIYKDKVFIKTDINYSGTPDNGEGLIIQLGTGKVDGVLVDACSAKGRLGRIASAGFAANFSFPVQYNIHFSNDAQNEVFLIVKTDIDTYQYLAFGQSSISGIGAWMSAISPLRFSSETNSSITLEPTFDGLSFVYSKIRAFWWCLPNLNSYFSPESCCEVCRDETNAVWLNDDPNAGIDAMAFPVIRDLIQRQPSAWSSNAILLPINIYTKRPENKVSQIISINNARYVRIDNFEPEQIVTLGMERWKIYPFYRKNSVERDGWIESDHSGTFGWAIRYDGP